MALSWGSWLRTESTYLILKTGLEVQGGKLFAGVWHATNGFCALFFSPALPPKGQAPAPLQTHSCLSLRPALRRFHPDASGKVWQPEGLVMVLMP